MRHIAIIKGSYYYLSDDNDVIALSITDWSVVSEEDYVLLTRWVCKSDYKIIERMDAKHDFLPKTIAVCKEKAKVYDEEQRKIKEEAAKKKLERELKKKAKTEEQEKKLLEELQRKYKEDYNENIRSKTT